MATGQDGQSFPARPSLIDAPTLMADAELFGERVMRSVLEKVAALYPAQLEQTARLIAAGNYAELRRTAYQLASSFANAHAYGLQKLALRMKREAEKEQPENLAAILAQINQAAAGFREELAQVLKSLKD